MAFRNPKGRVNYEPNSWSQPAAGPRESPETGFHTFPAAEEGPKVRERGALFADHFSQARQFYLSQTPVEQRHIADAFTFELSKVETPAIRERLVANLRNVDEALAATIADGLGMPLPQASEPARPVVELAPSPALSILRNPPPSFEGRKVGALVTDGTNADILVALKQAVEAEGAVLELIAPKIGGIVASDGTRMPAHHAVAGGPSVLFDAVAVLASEEGAAILAENAAAKDFVTDAYAHAKFIALVPTAQPIFRKAGLTKADKGFVNLNGPGDVPGFIEACRALRFWDREPKVK